VITLRVQAPYGTFRKSYARSFAESYPLPPPATVYGMLLSLVGERRRARHVGVKLAFAYAREPLLATTLRKLSRYKYGVSGKQEKLGNAPDFVETLCGIEFLCWVDSADENEGSASQSLETRLTRAVREPQSVDRSGIVCLGLSDDAVDDIALVERCEGQWRWLSPRESGTIELPTWVDHVGSLHTRWQRYELDQVASQIEGSPDPKRFTAILDPRPVS
jgi:CRISPR-associated protein Cas5t